jgi:hypothetical protein
MSRDSARIPPDSQTAGFPGQPRRGRLGDILLFTFFPTSPRPRLGTFAGRARPPAGRDSCARGTGARRSQAGLGLRHEQHPEHPAAWAPPAAVVPGRGCRGRGRRAGRRRDDAAHAFRRHAGPPTGRRLRPGHLCRQPAARGHRRGSARRGAKCGTGAAPAVGAAAHDPAGTGPDCAPDQHEGARVTVGPAVGHATPRTLAPPPLAGRAVAAGAVSRPRRRRGARTPCCARWPSPR